jgi:F1F0 ATPase subunit 2
MLVRMEMDEDRMSIPLFSTLPDWTPLAMAIHLAAGIAVGILYFRVLWWNVRRLTGGGRVMTTIGLMIGRFVLLAGFLTLASLEGAPPLLMAALGVLIGRYVVMRGGWEAAP